MELTNTEPTLDIHLPERAVFVTDDNRRARRLRRAAYAVTGICLLIVAVWVAGSILLLLPLSYTMTEFEGEVPDTRFYLTIGALATGVTVLFAVTGLALLGSSPRLSRLRPLLLLLAGIAAAVLAILVGDWTISWNDPGTLLYGLPPAAFIGLTSLASVALSLDLVRKRTTMTP